MIDSTGSRMWGAFMVDAGRRGPGVAPPAVSFECRLAGPLLPFSLGCQTPCRSETGTAVVTGVRHQRSRFPLAVAFWCRLLAPLAVFSWVSDTLLVGDGNERCHWCQTPVVALPSRGYLRGCRPGPSCRFLWVSDTLSVGDGNGRCHWCQTPACLLPLAVAPGIWLLAPLAVSFGCRPAGPS